MHTMEDSCDPVTPRMVKLAWDAVGQNAPFGPAIWVAPTP